MGKWIDVPLCPGLSPIIKSLRNQKNSPDILNDPFLTSPNSQGGNQASLTPASSLTPSDSSDQTKTPPPPRRENPYWNILSASPPLSSGPIWALSGLNFSYETTTTEKERWFLTGWPQYSLDSRENLLRKNFFWNCKSGSSLHMQLEKASLLKYFFQNSDLERPPCSLRPGLSGALTLPRPPLILETEGKKTRKLEEAF